MGFDVLIVGAGLVGLAIAKELSPACSCLVIDKHLTFGNETSSRNSEVIHSGLYYPQQSLKALLCVEGNRLIYEHCKKYGVEFAKCGKLVISRTIDITNRIHEVFENAKLNGAKDIRFLSRFEAEKIATSIKFNEAFFAEQSGIVNSHRLMQSFEALSANNSATFLYGHKLIALSKTSTGYKATIESLSGEISVVEVAIVVNSAGLAADAVANMLDISDDNLKINYCKGHYFKIANKPKYNFKHLVYPVQESSDSGLGIHLTIDLNGNCKLGPDTVFTNKLDYSVPEDLKDKFFSYAASYISGLSKDDIYPDYSGIRPKLQTDGGAFRDFYIKEESSRGLAGFINLIGIESPGLTASIAIAKYVSKLI